MLKREVERSGSTLTNKHVLIVNFKLIFTTFVLFHTVLSGMQNESFNGGNRMNAAALRQSMEIKLKNYRKYV